MTRVGIISDTHLKSPDPDLAKKLAHHFKNVAMVLHAGDITDLSVLDMIAAPNVIAVCGNMDNFVVAQSLPIKRTIKVEGFNIGLIHGYGAPNGLAQRVRTEFTDIDVLVFGHSHKPTNYVDEGVLFFNPGSCKSGYNGKATIGILTFDKTVTGEIIEL